MVIGLDHFSKFGFEVRGVPSFPPKMQNDENKVLDEVNIKSEDHEEVDGLTAPDLSHEVKDAQDKDQQLSPLRSGERLSRLKPVSLFSRNGFTGRDK